MFSDLSLALLSPFCYLPLLPLLVVLVSLAVHQMPLYFISVVNILLLGNLLSLYKLLLIKPIVHIARLVLLRLLELLHLAQYIILDLVLDLINQPPLQPLLSVLPSHPLLERQPSLLAFRVLIHLLQVDFFLADSFEKSLRVQVVLLVPVLKAVKVLRLVHQVVHILLPILVGYL